MSVSFMFVFTLLMCHLGFLTNPAIGTPIRLVSSNTNSNSLVRIVKTCLPGQFIKHDCKFYIDCYKGRWRRNFCGPDKFWNSKAHLCDDLHNVPECYQLYGSITSTSKSVAQTKPLREFIDISTTTSTEKVPVVDTVQSPVEQSARVRTYEMVINNNDRKKEVSTEKSIPTEVTTLLSVSTSTEDVKEDYDYDEDAEESYFEKDQSKTRVNRSDMEVDVPSNEIPKETILTKDDKSFKMLTYGKSDTLGPSGHTIGKTCIIRGKEMVCSETPDRTTEPSNQVFSRSTVEPSNSSTLVVAEGTVVNSKCDSDTHTIEFTIRIDRSFFDFLRAITYYINLTIFAWKSS